jgi:hypothetical protein
MLVLMFDPWFKSLLLVFGYLGREIIVLVILRYNEKLLLPFLMEAHKLLKFNNVEVVEDLELQVNYKYLFQTMETTINTYKDFVSQELIGFHQFPMGA